MCRRRAITVGQCARPPSAIPIAHFERSLRSRRLARVTCDHRRSPVIQTPRDPSLQRLTRVQQRVELHGSNTRRRGTYGADIRHRGIPRRFSTPRRIGKRPKLRCDSRTAPRQQSDSCASRARDAAAIVAARLPNNVNNPLQASPRCTYPGSSARERGGKARARTLSSNGVWPVHVPVPESEHRGSGCCGRTDLGPAPNGHRQESAARCARVRGR